MWSSLGFGYHKESHGRVAYSLGHEVSPQGRGIRCARPLLWKVIGAMEDLLRAGAYGVIWCHVVSFGAIWCHLDPCFID